ncbi:hypothetical protein [Nocardiopsis tropica]|uniref:Uncharacterized protein n=1 Tax=Nocardiopsis tropica TaxID=109330 RepID=A0ABU7KQY4_9ACTN|nr:hypothetical protein [Nocardiopsis umidischolae]MEE2051710.1 hypothetical protein [Nocardiopsis umidischolae]
MDAVAELLTWPDVGAIGLLSLVAILLFTGRLVPGGTVERLLAGRDERIAELKALLDEARSDGRRKDEQLGEFVEIGRTSAHVLEEIRRVAKEGPGEDA